MIFYEDPDEKSSWMMRAFRNIVTWWAMFVGLFGVGIISLLILGPPLGAIYNVIVTGGCRGDSPRNVTTDAREATVLRVIGDRGDLSVVGRPGLTEIQVRGVACASHRSKDDVDSIVLNTSFEGGKIIVAVIIPASIEGGRLDLEILVPEDLPRVEIDDAHGPVFVTNVRELEVTVGNGVLEATRIGGSVNVSSLRGSMSLSDVLDDVTVDAIHGYGTVEIDGVGGSVVLGVNRSGPAKIANVGGNVIVGNAGYGDLSVSRVAGYLLVEENPGGQLQTDRIGGSVRLPGNSDGDS